MYRQGTLVEVAQSTLTNELFRAVRKGHFGRLGYLLDGGASSSAVNDQGQGLLVRALHAEDPRQRARMFRYLLKRRVDFRAVDRQYKRDVLGWAANLGREEEVSYLLQVTAGDLDLLARDRDGCTALHHAVRGNHMGVVRPLVTALAKYGLSVDVPDNQGCTPYIYAQRLGHLDIAKVLVQEGNASSTQFDIKTFRHAEEWAEIGAKEREFEAREAQAREESVCRMLGRLPQASNGNVFLPSIVISSPDDQVIASSRSSSNDSLKKKDLNQNGNSGKCPPLNSNSSVNVVKTDRQNGAFSFRPSKKSEHFGQKPYGDITRGMSADGKTNGMTIRTKSDFILAARSGMGYPMVAATSRSLDIAVSLLDLAKETGSTNHATNFISSEPTMSQQYSEQTPRNHGVTSHISSLPEMMQILSDQKSDGFRTAAVVKPVRPPTPVVVSRPTPKKRNVSTLAIITGKDTRRRGHRTRTRVANAKNNAKNKTKMKSQVKAGQK